jgi:twitching motility protein PilI
MEQVFKAVNDTNSFLSERSPSETIAETVFGIRIGSMGFLASTAIYCEILDKTPVNVLPNVHPWLSGLLNLRGNLVPVFDLSVVLEEEVADTNKRRLFVFDRGDKMVALWVNDIPDIKDSAQLKPLKTLPPLPQLLQRFVMGAYEQNGQVWLNVAFEELFKALGRHQFATEDMAI